MKLLPVGRPSNIMFFSLHEYSALLLWLTVYWCLKVIVSRPTFMCSSAKTECHVSTEMSRPHGQIGFDAKNSVRPGAFLSISVFLFFPLFSFWFRAVAYANSCHLSSARKWRNNSVVSYFASFNLTSVVCGLFLIGVITLWYSSQSKLIDGAP